MEVTDWRERLILEMPARLKLDVVNKGDTTTLRRAGDGGTIPDVTFASETLVRRIHEWHVIEDYTDSDHHYIYFGLSGTAAGRSGNCKPTGWNVARMNEEALISVMRSGENEILSLRFAEEVAGAVIGLIRKAYDMAMPRRKNNGRHRGTTYWWTRDIANLRKMRLELCRKITRTRRRNPYLAERESEYLKSSKAALKKAINTSKRSRWEDLRQEVNADPWGLGYRIVTKKLGNKSNLPSFDEALMETLVKALFPKHPDGDPDPDIVGLREIPLFGEEELFQAAMDIDCLRERHSTISAIREIVDTFRIGHLRNRHSIGLVMLVTLDVKKVFKRVR